MEEKKSPEGIGGWLVLPLLGLIISPFRVSFSLYRDIWPVFSGGHWQALTTSTSEAYHPLWAPLLVLELVGNVAIVIVGLVALWLFLRKSRLAPRWVISWLGLIFALTVTDFVLANRIPIVAAEKDPEAIKELARSVIAAAIWIPYFLVSKRVKATFVN